MPYLWLTDHGPFRERMEIGSIKGIGKVTCQQSVGFLRITPVRPGDNVLEATQIHPERYGYLDRDMCNPTWTNGSSKTCPCSYPVATQLLKLFSLSLGDIGSARARQIIQSARANKELWGRVVEVWIESVSRTLLSTQRRLPTAICE